MVVELGMDWGPALVADVVVEWALVAVLVAVAVALGGRPSAMGIRSEPAHSSKKSQSQQSV